jgi:putative two-component system response regulator
MQARSNGAPGQKPLVLVVDDADDILALIGVLLQPHCRTKTASNGEEAIASALADPVPDLILLDIMMPGISGIETCERLKADARTRGIPVIFLTALSERRDEQRGLEVGAVDYISKPISAPILLARIKTHLALKAAADFLKDKNTFLEEEVARRTREVEVIQDVTIVAMASLADTRSKETGSHLRRTQHYVRALAKGLQGHAKLGALLDDKTIEILFKSAPLHDIGKVGIPDAILLKPGKLTHAEFEVMKTHTTLGRDAIAAAEKQIDAPHTFLRVARDIAYSHQEKWDGTGYPEGLAGEAIPVAARLMAVADCYDALISPRVYKAAYSHEKSVAIINARRGRHFDPDMVDAFLGVQDEFAAIAKRYPDSA